jgi:hypothetical protein
LTEDAVLKSKKPKIGDRVGGAAHYDPIPETAKEALTKWDLGDPVFTVSMGGLGPGYEQCIHIIVFELLREYLDKPLLDTNDREACSAWGDAIINELDKKYGFSGAQVGAAKHLAVCFLRDGYRKTVRALPSDRLIQVAKYFPS